MHYPTHSTSQIISVTGARMTHVSCHGFVDRAGDGLYGPGTNRWNNPFSDQTALFRMSDGSCCRVNEFRRIGHPEVVRMSLFGTEGSFEENAAGAVWLTKERPPQRPGAPEPGERGRRRQDGELLDDLLAPRAVTTAHGTYAGLSSVHPVERLPREFAGIASGHQGSHAFLVDDFVRACAERLTPPNNVWMAARYALPGIVAHESALRGGELLEIPDFGDPPAATAR
jgi:hypothetical protein